MDEIGTLLSVTLALSGFGGIIALLVNVGKAAGIVKDGQAPTWTTGLNLALMAVVFGLKVFSPGVNLEGLDEQAGQLASIGVLVLQFILTNLGSRLMHTVVKGAPLVGYSYASKLPRPT